MTHNIHNRVSEQLSRRQRQYLHVAILLTAAILLRVLLYYHIAARGDLGYYLLDAEYILDGQRPFFDFVGRSPLYLYLYAGYRAILGGDIWVYRAYTTTFWIATSLLLYAYTRQLHSHTAGLAAAAFTLSPFALAYTYFSSPQSVAVALALTAFTIIAYRSLTTRTAFIIGILLAAAFLSRRSMVLIPPVIIFYAFYDTYHTHASTLEKRLRTTITITAKYTISLTTGYLATLAIAYLALAHGEVAAALDVFVIHFVNLFVSTGSGGVPLLSAADAVASGQTYTVTNTPPFLALLDYRSRTAIMVTILTVLPLLASLVTYLRATSLPAFTTYNKTIIQGSIVGLTLYASVTAIQAGFYSRGLWPPLMLSLLYLLYRRPPVDRRWLTHPLVVLSIVTWLAVAFGYAFRPNLYAAYYAMDAVPFVMPAAAVMYVELYREASIPWRRIATILLVLSLVVSATPLSPLVVPGVESDWNTHHRVRYYTPTKIDALGSGIDHRIDDGVVLTMQPNHVATADADAFEENTRALYLAHVFHDTGPMKSYYQRVIDAMRSGDIELVVGGEALTQLLQYNATTRSTFTQCYRPVDANGLYTSINTTLYRWNGC